ncbi:DeoR family transcriptional regulator [Streptomyces sp. NPDC094048]|uniref:DeoR family transcriptional regulator n=1 Tax=Streptomyces sp. NPDC094048 TaxID=3155207 RepID=UPI003327B292
MTVRRDVTILADRGLVQRVHGGVTQPHRSHPPEQRALTASSPFGRLPGQVLVGMVVPTVEFYWPPVIQGAQSAVAAADGRPTRPNAPYTACSCGPPWSSARPAGAPGPLRHQSAGELSADRRAASTRCGLHPTRPPCGASNGI